MKTYLTLSLLLLLAFTPSQHLFAQSRTATVIGRFTIKSAEGGHYSKTRRLVFSSRFARDFSCLIKKKDSGYFEIKLPLGYNYIEAVRYYDGSEYFKKFTNGYLTIKLDSADRVYYVGDIELIWKIGPAERSTNEGMGFGLVGALIGEEARKEKESRLAGTSEPINISINQKTLDAFRSELGADSRIITAQIMVDKHAH